MKTGRFLLTTIITGCLCNSIAYAQQQAQAPREPVTIKEFLVPQPNQNCLPAEHEIPAQAAGESIMKAGKAENAMLPLFDWPIGLTLRNGLNIGNYVDDDPGNGIKDYMGFSHAYNGHSGTDIGPTGFRAMDRGIPILAAAEGTVIEIEYTKYDRNIEAPFPDGGNYVKLRHDDGTETWYWHLRKNSVAVNVGERVQAGQMIGLMGSSGFSTDPHLHFAVEEFVNGGYRFRDPWNGTYNTLPSLWKNQEPYLGNSFIVHDMDVFTEEAAGGNIENIPWRLIKEKLLQPAIYGIDERFLNLWLGLQGLAGDKYTAQIRRPDNSIYSGYDVTLSAKTMGWHIWVWFFSDYVSPADYGVWTANILVNGQIVKRVSFRVGATTVYSPRFWPIAGRSFRASNMTQRDTLRVSKLGGPVSYSLLNAPDFVSLTNDSVVTIAPASGQANRSLEFQALATDGFGRTDTMWYHIVDPSKPFAAKVEVALQSGSVVFGDTLTIPVLVSTNESLSLGQVVVEYDGTLLELVEAQTGAATPGFSLNTNADPPFEPTNAGANKNVLVQVAGAGTFSGTNQEIIRLRLRPVLEADTTTTVFFDRASDHSFFATADGMELSGSSITYNNGEVAIAPEALDLTGAVSYLESGISISGARLELRHSHGTSLDTTEADGGFAFSLLEKDSVRLAPEKTGDLRNALTGADAMLALRGLAFLDTLYASQRLAADVSENGTASGAYAVALLRYLAFLPVPLGHPGEWRFLPPDTTFMLSQDSELTFTGYVLGDVNLSWGLASAAVTADVTTANGESAIAKLHLPALSANKGDTVAIAIHFSSDSAMSFVQFTMANDSTALQYVETRAGIGSHGMNLLVNPTPAFFPQNTGTNQEIVVQLSGVTNEILGQDQEIALVLMKVISEEGRETPLVFDQQHDRTMMTTENFTDVTGAEIEGIAGKITIRRATTITDRIEGLPATFALWQNHPNPFNPSTRITFALPRPSRMTLKVYDLAGKEVATLLDDERKTAAVHEVMFDASGLPSGVYFYRVSTGEFKATKKMLLVR